LDHPCYHNETFIADSKCTFQLKGLCYSFHVNEYPITYEETIVDPQVGRMPCSKNTMNNNKEWNLGVQDLPTSKRPITKKLIFKTKTNNRWKSQKTKNQVGGSRFGLILKKHSFIPSNGPSYEL
jgi:hypothetical protein